MFGTAAPEAFPVPCFCADYCHYELMIIEVQKAASALLLIFAGRSLCCTVHGGSLTQRVIAVEQCEIVNLLPAQKMLLYLVLPAYFAILNLGKWFIKQSLKFYQSSIFMLIKQIFQELYYIMNPYVTYTTLEEKNKITYRHFIR